MTVPPTASGATRTVIIGIDPHKRSHTAVALDEDDEQLDQLRVVAEQRQVVALLGGSSQHGWLPNDACNVYAESVLTTQPHGREKLPMPPEVPPEVDAERRRVVAELGQMGFTLPGSVVTRTVTCGRSTCRCATDPDQRHGPYIQWSRTVKGRTVNKMLTPQQLADYQPWIDNNRRLRDLTHQLETVSLEVMRTAQGWER